MRDPGTSRAVRRLGGMLQRAFCLVLIAVFVAACGSTPVPTGGQLPTPSVPALTQPPAATPSQPGPESTLHPLQANVSGIPGPADVTAEIAPHTPRGELEVGVARDFLLGHCGLVSPIDIDGSLWDPIGAHNGAGAELTEDQLGELINGTQTVVVLTEPDTMELRTPRGAVVVLARHEGPRHYFLCD